MYSEVDPYSQKTNRYWRHVIASIVRPSLLKVGDIVRFTARENSHYFPGLSERAAIIRTMRMVKHVTGKDDYHRDAIPVHPLRQEAEQIWDKENVRDSIQSAVSSFTMLKLHGMCAARGWTATESGPVCIHFAFKVLDPIRLYDEAKRLKIKILNERNVAEYYTAYKSEWLENPPRIKWGITEILLPKAGLSVDVCRAAYDYEPGETVHPWDIMEEIDPERFEEEEKGGRAVYNCLRKINKKVKGKTRRELFEWTTRAFSRIA